MYEIKDTVTIAGEEAKIVKVFSDDDQNITYCLITDDNNFVYKMDETISAAPTVSCKRKKTDDHLKSNTSSISGWSWYKLSQMDDYLIKIENCTDFRKFFEIPVIPENVPDEFSDIENVIDWVVVRDNEKKAVKKYKNSVDQFQLYQTEATVRDCVRNVLDFLDMEFLMGRDSSLGKIDMVLSNKDGSCVFDNKAGVANPRNQLSKYEPQLAAYMVATAIVNRATMKIISTKTDDVQNIIGVIHCGLTPVFYKAEFTKEYIEFAEKLKTSAGSSETKETLNIIRYSPYSSYLFTDRELIRLRSRPLILKSYHAMKLLNDKYQQQKCDVVATTM